ncbi:myoD family inhibitor [Scomber scombrus]|uniref:MyoD family inhibitor n=1 Tax=Scomber scombrus TaxID=13677 RepID=A0AAV1PVH8_SCOSC
MEIELQKYFNLSRQKRKKKKRSLPLRMDETSQCRDSEDDVNTSLKQSECIMSQPTADRILPHQEKKDSSTKMEDCGTLCCCCFEFLDVCLDCCNDT